MIRGLLLLENTNQTLDLEAQEDQSTQMQSAVQSLVRALYDVRADGAKGDPYSEQYNITDALNIYNSIGE